MKKITTFLPIWDFVSISALIAISLFLVSPYLNAHYLAPGYPDWMVHAYRVKFLQLYGLSSWAHLWSNGMNIFRSYQFIPHYLTLWLAQISHVEIPRAMILMTIIQFILIRIEIYALLRYLGFTSLVAFLCTLFSFDIAQYWGTVSDYSLMFGVTFFPVMVFFAIQYARQKISLLLPFCAGVAIYLHPLLCLYSAGLWIIVLLFSGKKIISKQIAIEIILFCIATSVFWSPFVIKSSYTYLLPIFTTRYFLNLVLSHYEYMGLSLSLVWLLICTVIFLFSPHASKHTYAFPLMLFSCITLCTIAIGLALPIPAFIAKLQYTRGVSFPAIAIIISSAPLVQWVLTIKSQFIKGVIIFVLCSSLIEGIWFSSIYGPNPVQNFQEPVTEYLRKHPDKPLTDGRIWVPDIGLASYFLTTNMRLPISYMTHQEPNQTAPRLYPLMGEPPYLNSIPKTNIDRIEAYFRVTGTKYAFFEETSPFTRSLADPTRSNFRDLGTVDLTHGLYHVFELAGRIPNAVLVPSSLGNNINAFADSLELSSINDQTQLDIHILNLSRLLMDSRTKDLTVEYPDQEHITILNPHTPAPGDSIFLNESFDRNWKIVNDASGQITPVGPNFMRIRSTKDRILLEHSWPLYWYIEWFAIMLTGTLILTRHVIYIFSHRYASHSK